MKMREDPSFEDLADDGKSEMIKSLTRPTNPAVADIILIIWKFQRLICTSTFFGVAEDTYKNYQNGGTIHCNHSPYEKWQSHRRL